VDVGVAQVAKELLEVVLVRIRVSIKAEEVDCRIIGVCRR
jgi:hypothetical protein